jgi:hypothetical protein
VLDRQRTDKELDALADLYLTGPDDTNESSSKPEAMAIGTQRDSSARRRKAPGQPHQTDDASESYDRYPGTRSTGLMTQPQPAKLTPRIAAAASSNNTSTSSSPSTSSPTDEQLLQEQLDELTAAAKRDEPTLRLVNLELESAMPVSDDTQTDLTDQQDDDMDASSDRPAYAAMKRQARSSDRYHADNQSSILQIDEPIQILDKRVEVVFLGNLPGFASPWMTQYAQHVALECGVVGVLHIDDEQIDLDFVTTPANRVKLDSLHKQVMDYERADDLIAVLDLLNQGADPVVGAWLIHLATPLTATTKTIARSLPVWTLLSGVDEAAGARAMDWLSHCMKVAEPADMGHVQFMAMGCDIDRAVAMIRQLDERALDQWDTAIELVGVQRQMVPVHLQTLGSFPTMLEQWPVVAKLVAGDAASADHRSALVTRIDPATQNTKTQVTPPAPELDEDDQPIAAAKPRRHDFEATVTAEEARNLLMAAAKMDGISIQGVELEETEADNVDELADQVTEEQASTMEASPLEAAHSEDLSDTGAFDALADEDIVDELDEMEDQAVQISDDVQPTGHDIATHAVPEPEVVSETIRSFVERLKQQELEKRRQAQQDAQAQTESVIDDMDDVDADDADDVTSHTREPEPAMRVAQVAKASEGGQDVHAHILHQPSTPAFEPMQPKHKAQPTTQRLVASAPQSKSRPTAEPDHVRTHASAQPHLASFLQEAGMISLVARCPQHPMVELTLDESGGLHLLARHQQATGKSVNDVLYELLDARGWVDQHISLLSMTQKQLRFDMQLRPVVHLFTDDAKAGAKLVANSARFVKLHLFSEVTVGHDKAFYCTELN